MKCVRCNKPIDPERLEVLPDTRRCAGCSDEAKLIGFMTYAHKTAGFVQFVKPTDKEGLRRAMRAHHRAR
jgi:hypothetical protein